MKSDLLHYPTARVIIGAIAISFSGVWVKIAGVSPASSAFYRVFFGALFLLAFFLGSKRKKTLGNLRYHLLGALCGVIFVFDLLCWHWAIIYVGPGLATLLGNFQVFILATIGIIFLGERYTRRLVIAIPLAMGGLYCIVGVDWQTLTGNYRTGIYLGLATAVFYSGYLLSLKQLSSDNDSRYYPMLLVSLSASLALGGYIGISPDTFALPDMKSGVSLVALGFLSQCLGWILISTSLPKLNLAFAGLLLLLQPSLAFVWDVLFFDRPTSVLNWIGVGLALTAIYLGITAKHVRKT